MSRSNAVLGADGFHVLIDVPLCRVLVLSTCDLASRCHDSSMMPFYSHRAGERETHGFGVSRSLRCACHILTFALFTSDMDFECNFQNMRILAFTLPSGPMDSERTRQTACSRETPDLGKKLCKRTPQT